MPVLGKSDNPYSTARDWLRASPAIRRAISRQRRSDYRRIAQLGDAWGLRLEELGASYRLLRWVAGPGCAGASQREARYRGAVRALLDGPMSRVRFAALTLEFPRMRRTGTGTSPRQDVLPLG
jgi:hypothetical protein